MIQKTENVTKEKNNKFFDFWQTYFNISPPPPPPPPKYLYLNTIIIAANDANFNHHV